MQALEISRSGLDVEWQRLQVIASNLANINTSRTASGDPYRAMRLVSGPRTGFSNLLSGAPGGVEVQGLEPVQGNARRIYEPGHPHADADGFVTYPAIDHAGEMTLLIQTARAYEANLTAMGIAQQMYARAMQLGRQS
jgi:flagellar basal-body rod protein FlgC